MKRFIRCLDSLTEICLRYVEKRAACHDRLEIRDFRFIREYTESSCGCHSIIDAAFIYAFTVDSGWEILDNGRMGINGFLFKSIPIPSIQIDC